MVTYLIILIVLALVQFILLPLYLLPNATFSASVVSILSAGVSYAHNLYSVLPITTTVLFSLISIYLVIEGSILSWRVLMWVKRLIPGQG